MKSNTNVTMAEKHREDGDANVTARKQSSRERLKRFLKKTSTHLAPQSLRDEIRRYRKFEGEERLLYVKIRIAGTFRFTNAKDTRPPKTARSFLFVCFGNIMRSPFCEALMKQALPNVRDGAFTIVSAGLNAIPGRPAHSWAVTAAGEFGISLENHHATLLTAEMVEQADAILAMDYQNLVQLLSRYPSAKSRIYMLSSYAGDEYGDREIPDPYYMDEEGRQICYTLLHRCVTNLVSSVCVYTSTD